MNAQTHTIDWPQTTLRELLDFIAPRLADVKGCRSTIDLIAIQCLHERGWPGQWATFHNKNTNGTSGTLFLAQDGEILNLQCLNFEELVARVIEKEPAVTSPLRADEWFADVHDFSKGEDYRKSMCQSASEITKQVNAVLSSFGAHLDARQLDAQTTSAPARPASRM